MRVEVRKLLTFLGVALALLAAVWLGSPYFTVWRLSQAVKSGDAAQVSRAIDFPALRENLKPKLRAYLEAETARKPGSFLDRLGLALASSLMGTAVDVVVTPEAVTAMLRTAKPPKVAGPAGPPPPDEAPGPRSPTDTRAVRMGYVGGDLDLFTASLASRARPERAVGLKLTRRGVWDWRVVDLELPARTLARKVRPFRRSP
jgi:hypothetical protein